MSGIPPSAFDPEIIAYLRAQSDASGPDFLKEILDVFLGDAPLKLDDLEAALRCGNADWLMRSAHDLGGGSGNVGAAGLSALCRKVEIQARSGLLTGIESDLARILDEFELVAAEAARLLMDPSRA